MIIQTENEGALNLHLGPLSALAHVIDQLSVDQSVAFDAFRTEAMPDKVYIAKALTLEDKVIQLRDDNLRPSWAVPQGDGQGAKKGARMQRRCW